MATDDSTPIPRALIFANGDLNDGPAVRAALAHAPDARIIAVDGGARLALACGLDPEIVIGDMDSLSPGELDDLRARGAQIDRYPPAKDETDLELALLHVAQTGADWMRIIGAVGNRFDQTLANLYLLTLDVLAGRDVQLVSGAQTIRVLGPGAHTLHGAAGDTLSLLPLAGDVTNIRTEGLDYPLRGEPLKFGPARGVSNVFGGQTARVSFDAGLLVVVHAHDIAPDDAPGAPE